MFTYKNKPLTRICNTAWKRARRLTGIDVRVHHLKHTFGRRLRAAGVSFEDCQNLLGHKSGRITTHYSAELTQLIEADNSICSEQRTGPTLTVLKNVVGASSRKSPAWSLKENSKIAVSGCVLPET